jgi:hypothetical protein
MKSVFRVRFYSGGFRYGWVGLEFEANGLRASLDTWEHENNTEAYRSDLQALEASLVNGLETVREALAVLPAQRGEGAA